MRREMTYFDVAENSVGALTTRLSEDARVVSEATGVSIVRPCSC